MAKKTTPHDLAVRQVIMQEHMQLRAIAEDREENPRDSVYTRERVDEETGEVIKTVHRVPDRAFVLDHRGHEKLDPIPVAPPVHQAPMSTFDQIREFNRRQQILNGWPDATLEDEDNFDIPDDPVDPNTQWEVNFEVASIQEVFQRARQVLSDRKKASARPAEPVPPSDGPNPPVSGTPATKPPSPQA